MYSMERFISRKIKHQKRELAILERKNARKNEMK